MATHENAPPPSDWMPMPGFVCGSCGGDENLCCAVRVVDRVACCFGCTHGYATTAPLIAPLTWDGDYS